MRVARGLALAALVVAGSADAQPVRPPSPTLRLARPHVARFRIGRRLQLRRWRHGLRPFAGRRHFQPDVPPDLLTPPPPGEFVQPEGPGPSPLLEGEPLSRPPLPRGFVLTVKVGVGQSFDAPATLDRFIEVGQALGRCFAPPAGLSWGSITLRVAFKRDGAVFGLPRIPYSDAATADQKTELAHSLLAGLKRCTPLPLSPSLGAAVAGEIFAIRFINEDQR